MAMSFHFATKILLSSTMDLTLPIHSPVRDALNMALDEELANDEKVTNNTP